MYLTNLKILILVIVFMDTKDFYINESFIRLSEERKK